MNRIQETPGEYALPGDEELPGDDAGPLDEPAEPAAENRDGSIATALAMWQTGTAREVVCAWLADACPQSIGTAEKAAKALAAHSAGF